MTDKQRRVLGILAGYGWMSPTDVGQLAGKDKTASSWACPALKALVRDGLAAQSGGAYQLTDAGRRETLKL